jgi:hypothetical protein
MVAKMVSTIEPYIVAFRMGTSERLSCYMVLEMLADEVSLQAVSVSEVLGPLCSR